MICKIHYFDDADGEMRRVICRSKSDQAHKK